MKKKLLIIAIFALVAFAGVAFKQGTVHAWLGGVDEIPSANISPNWSSIFLEISKPGGSGNTLDAPESSAKLSYPNPSADPTGKFRYRIYDFCMGNTSVTDYGIATGYAQGDCFNGGANVTIATVCAMDANEQITSNCQTISSCPFGCAPVNDWTPYLDITLGGLVTSATTGAYNFSIKLTFANYAAVPAGNLNGFRVEASWGRAGFIASTKTASPTPLAVQNRNKSQNYSGTNHEDNMDFHFRVSCDFTASSFNLHWYDADTNTFDPDIAWRLTNTRNGEWIDASTYAFFAGQSTATYMGGNGVDRIQQIDNNISVGPVQFHYVPGDELVWTWRDVQANNGVTMYMPFDDANTNNGNCNPIINTYNVACGPVSFSNNSPEPGDTFSVTLRLLYSGSNRTYSFTNISLGGLSGSTANRSGTTTGNQSYTINGVSGASPGVYTVRYRATIEAKSVDCTGVIAVIVKPYVKVYGNDIAAGGNFAGTGCAPTDPNASIYAFSKVTNPWTNQNAFPERWSGSSSQFATFSLGKTQGLFSAGQHSPRRNTTGTNQTTPVNHLAFGNYDPNNQTSSIAGATSATASNILDPTKVPEDGGNSGIYRCVTDFYNSHPAVSTVGGSHNLNANPDGSYFYNNDITIGAANNYSRHQAIYVNGDVTINGNIVFDDNYANVTEIPSLWIIARGNIRITNNVTNVAGVMVSQPFMSGGVLNGGTILTCTPASGTYSGTQLYDNCRSKLTIDGAFIAQQVKLLRSFGTLKNSAENEAYNSNQAGEVFTTGAGLYLGTQPDSLLRSAGCVNSNCGYDAITSLPPTL